MAATLQVFCSFVPSLKLFSSKAVYLFLRLILVTFSYSRALWLQDMRSTVAEGQAIARDNQFL